MSQSFSATLWGSSVGVDHRKEDIPAVAGENRRNVLRIGVPVLPVPITMILKMWSFAPFCRPLLDA
jgi:hypothetical protein